MLKKKERDIYRKLKKKGQETKKIKSKRIFYKSKYVEEFDSYSIIFNVLKYCICIKPLKMLS